MNKPAVALTNNNTAKNTFDRDLNTRWESTHGVDPQWIYVDLGDVYSIEGVKLTWETAYATNFQIDVSDDAITWTTIAAKTNNTGLENNLVNSLDNLIGSGRYVRMYGLNRATQYGYSLWEFEVYGTDAPILITFPVSGATYTAPASLAVNIDGSSLAGNIAKIEVLSGNSVLDTRTTEPFIYTVPLDNLAAGNYNLYTKIYHQDGTVTTSSGVAVYVVPATTGAISCGEPVTLAASGAPEGGTYRWYHTSFGGTPIPDATENTYTTPPIDFTTDYYVAAVSPEGQESRRAIVVASSNSLAQIATTGLTSSYPFHGNAEDATGHGNDGIVNGATLATDRFGNENNAYSFDGVDDYITTTTSFPTNIEGTNVFSLSLWFKTSTTTGGKMIGLGTNQTGASGQYDRHIYMTNTGQVVFGIYINTHRTIKTIKAFNDDQWHNVVATLAPSGIKLFIDGILEASDATVTEGEKYVLPGYWRIGYDYLGGWPDDPTSDHFTGLLDDVNIYYSTEISPEDLTKLYGARVDPIYAGQTLELKATDLEGVIYSWTGPKGFTSNEQNPTIPNATTDNAGEYTVTISNGACTSDPVTVTAIVNTTLPVSLISFKTNRINGTVQLQWSTATELNNRGFEIQRSQDGLSFRKIGFVEGAGNSQLIQNYSFADKHPVGNRMYYRLKQIDYDEQATYTKTVAVKLDAIPLIGFYPNPVDTKATLYWNTEMTDKATITITDSKGQVIFTKQIRGTDQNEFQLYLGKNIPGLYFLTLRRDESIIYRTKLVKQ